MRRGVLFSSGWVIPMRGYTGHSQVMRQFAYKCMSQLARCGTAAPHIADLARSLRRYHSSGLLMCCALPAHAVAATGAWGLRLTSHSRREAERAASLRVISEGTRAARRTGAARRAWERGAACRGVQLHSTARHSRMRRAGGGSRTNATGGDPAPTYGLSFLMRFTLAAQRWPPSNRRDQRAPLK
jgi:hypothetical protein